ncbi:MAG: HAD family phosphatase [Caldilineaceae bacterium]|nr:HAD family phosphatase [Caldilineaceae bacterium]
MSPSTIIFDLGGVLLEWNPRYLYRKLFEDEAAMESFLSIVCTPEWNVRQDAGRPFAEAVAELVERHPEQEALIRAYHERWEEMVPHAIEETVEILADVRAAGYRVAALSNWSAETYPLMRRRFDFLGWFETIVLSGEERCIKPDPQIYEILLRRLNQPAHECIFIDDSEKNIIVAQQMGIHAIHFHSSSALRQTLHEIGVVF